MAPDTAASLAKIGGQYVNSQFAKMEAVENGYSEAIVLDINGYVSEGSGENIFVVSDGVIHTTPLAVSILSGITRDSVMTIARELGYEVREQVISRDMYVADEIFTAQRHYDPPVDRSDGGDRAARSRRPFRAVFGITSGLITRLVDRHDA
jgi:branched-chain amino acid aminotransferase